MYVSINYSPFSSNVLKSKNFHAGFFGGFINKNAFVVLCVKNSVSFHTNRSAFFNKTNIVFAGETFSTKLPNESTLYCIGSSDSETMLADYAVRSKVQSLHTAYKRVPYFARAGNIARRESEFTSMFRKRAKNFDKSNTVSSNKGTGFSKRTSYSIFPLLYHGATPFVHLKTRRRGSRSKGLLQKVTHLTQTSGARERYRLFTKPFRTSRFTSKKGSFSKKLFSQIESLYQSGNNQTDFNETTSVKSDLASTPSSGTVKTIRDFRDDMHRTACGIKFVHKRNKRPSTVFRRYLKIAKKRAISFSEFNARYLVKLDRSINTRNEVNSQQEDIVLLLIFFSEKV